MKHEDTLIVVDPTTKISLDVMPLFRALQQFDAPDNAPLAHGAQDAVRRVIKTLNLIVHDPQITRPVDLANIFHDLYRLDDMFSAMQWDDPGRKGSYELADALDTIGQN